MSYTTAVVEADDSGSEPVPVESSDMVGPQHVALVTQEDGTQQQVREYNVIMTINILQITFFFLRSEDAHHIPYVKQTPQKSLKTAFIIMVTSGNSRDCKMTSDP